MKDKENVRFIHTFIHIDTYCYVHTLIMSDANNNVIINDHYSELHI